jgi:CheY-like chemotaxis protein/anti-sigma regulatory factor (Ser/Thr protein kinase)
MPKPNSEYRLLVVDDEPAVRELLAEIFRNQGYTVLTAPDGPSALEIMSRETFALIISDINMPEMKGYELLRRVALAYPAVKRVLITSYNVEDYISIALQYGISNIITKTTPFNIQEVVQIIGNLVQETIFGLERYLLPATDIQRLSVTDPREIHSYAGFLASQLVDRPKLRNRFQLVMVELLTNAIYYGIRREDGAYKEGWNENFTVGPDELLVTYGRDREKYGFAIRDMGGRLKKGVILYWLQRQIEQDEQGMPLGIMDTHGRGLFISRSYVDRFIVNLKPGHSTEVVGLNFIDTPIDPQRKPLIINEI